MDLNELVKIGDTHEREYIVKKEDTADYLGNIGVTVLSTPTMIKMMEETASLIIFHLLPEEYKPVGTKIDIEHINPTFINQKVSVKAELINIEDMKLTYEVEAYNETVKIGFGRYEQYVIDLQEFLNKKIK